MTALTLHAMDETLTAALCRHAAEAGESLNQAAKNLLARALGLAGASNRPEPGFMKFAGTLSPRAAKDLRAFVDGAGFSKVDEADWK